MESLSLLTTDAHSSRSSHAIVEKAATQEKCLHDLIYARFLHIYMRKCDAKDAHTLFSDAGELNVHTDWTAASWHQLTLQVRVC